MQHQQKFSRIVRGITVTIVIIVLVTGYLVYGQIHLSRQRAVRAYQDSFAVEALNTWKYIQEIQGLNDLVMHEPVLTNVLGQLARGQQPTLIARLMCARIIENIARFRNVSAAYILDPDGTCIFSSRSDFLGKNYGFRPYFTQAFALGRAIYFAQGVTSGQIGIYVAKRIEISEQRLGVSVIKLRPDYFTFKSSLINVNSGPSDTAAPHYGLAFANGVLVDFIGNRILSLPPLTPDLVKTIGQKKIAQLGKVQAIGIDSAAWETIKKNGHGACRVGQTDLLFFAAPVPETDLYLVQSMERNNFQAKYIHYSSLYIVLLASIFGFLLILSSLLIFLLDKRHKELAAQTRKMTETQEQLVLFSEAVEQSGNSIVITDNAACIQYVNPHFTQVTGYTREEALGQNPRILKSGYQDETVYRELWQTLSRHETWKGTLHNRKKNGELYWEEATISPIVNDQGEVTHYIAIKEDISDRIAITQQLKEETAKLNLIVEHAALCLIIALEERISWINAYGKAMFGYWEEDDIVGRDIELLFPDHETFVEFRRDINRQAQDKEHRKAELQLKKKSGSLFWCALSCRQMTDEKSRRGAIWVIEDITDRKHREQSLEKARQEAESANSFKTQMLRHVSHDIRTPLHGIIGALELLQTTSLNQVQDKLVSTSFSAATFLLNLLNTLLDLSKIEAGQMILENRPFSIRLLLAEIEEYFINQAEEKQLAFTITVQDQVPETLIGDPLRIKQILINLIGNSFKFTDRGAVTVTVEAQSRDDKWLLTFVVQDTGIGIHTKKLQNLFDAFTQADNSISRRYGGTGLGLSITRELCLLMQGSISCTSQPGQGTTFTVTLSCAATPEQTADQIAGKPPADAPTGHSLAILVVDDSQANREILEMMLVLENHQVMVATNGLEALRQLAQHRFDLVFLDMQMPVMNGLTTATVIRDYEKGNQGHHSDLEPDLDKALQQRLRGSHTLLIALTANTMREDRDQCLAAGMDDFLNKPFTRSDLGQLLGKWTAHLSLPGSTEPATPEPRAKPVECESDPSDPLTGIREFMQQNYSFSEKQIEQLLATSLTTIAGCLARLDELTRDGILITEDGMIQAHTLKGSLGTLGLTEAAEIAANLEQVIRQQGTGEAKEILERLQRQLAPLTGAWEAE